MEFEEQDQEFELDDLDEPQPAKRGRGRPASTNVWGWSRNETGPTKWEQLLSRLKIDESDHDAVAKSAEVRKFVKSKSRSCFVPEWTFKLLQLPEPTFPFGGSER